MCSGSQRGAEVSRRSRIARAGKRSRMKMIWVLNKQEFQLKYIDQKKFLKSMEITKNSMTSSTSTRYQDRWIQNKAQVSQRDNGIGTNHKSLFSTLERDIQIDQSPKKQSTRPPTHRKSGSKRQNFGMIKDISSIESDQSSLATISKITNPPEILMKMKKVSSEFYL